MLRVKGLKKAQPFWRMWVLIPIALGLSWVVVSLGRLGSTQQALTVLILAIMPLVSLIYLIKPHIVVNLFVFAIPLLIGQEVVAGLNLGELATLFIISLGVSTLLVLKERLIEVLRQLGPLIWPLLGLAFVGLISALVNSVSSFPEIVASVFKPLAFAVVTLLIFIHNDSPQKAHGLLRALFLGGFAVAGYSIFAYIMGWSYYPQYGYERVAGTFEHWNQLGGYMVLISMPTLFYALSARHFWTKAAFIFAFIAEIIVLLLSLTLGSILSLLVSGSVALFLLFKFSARRAVVFTLLLALSFISVWLTTPLLEARLGEIHERALDRLATYSAGLRLAQDHFWLGVGSTAKVLEAILYATEGYRFTHFGEISVIPHNSFISIWVEKGIFGLLLFIVVTVNSMRLLLRWRPSQESRYYLLHQGIIVGLIGFLIQNMSNNLLLHPRIGYVFFALIIAAVRISQLARSDKW